MTTRLSIRPLFLALLATSAIAHFATAQQSGDCTTKFYVDSVGASTKKTECSDSCDPSGCELESYGDAGKVTCQCAEDVADACCDLAYDPNAGAPFAIPIGSCLAPLCGSGGACTKVLVETIPYEGGFVDGWSAECKLPN